MSGLVAQSLTEQPITLVGDFGIATKMDDGGAMTMDREASEPAEAAFSGAFSTGKGRARGRKNSLALRKMPVDVLLTTDGKLVDEELSLDDSDHRGSDFEGNRTLLQRTCFNSKFTLRTQMMLSFGIISFATILLVVIVSIFISVISGEVVKERTRDTFNDLAATVAFKESRYLAEELTPRILMDDVVRILYETTKDRFYGYPSEDDSKVPFFDTMSKTNKYPIKGKPLPLDWQMEANVNKENQHEHIQGRIHLYGGEGSKISTAEAVYGQQGMCDPSVTDPTQDTYLQGCTDAHNNISTGGVYAPSPTNELIHRKASDLTPILKALYEYHQEIRTIGIYFSNSGAGSAISYPGNLWHGDTNYTSIGCDWLKSPHPLNPSRSILSEEEFERCTNGGTRINGAIINSRLFSNLDRAWCRDQALNPEKIMISGPFQHATAKGVWVIATGRAIYDPLSSEFVGCTYLGVDAVESLSSILETSRVSDNSHVSVVYRDLEGMVLASTAWDMKQASGSAFISELSVGVSKQVYKEFFELVNYGTTWNATDVRQTYDAFSVRSGSFHVKAYPIPPLPEVYDETYKPQFLVLVSISTADLFLFANQIDKDVDSRVLGLTYLSVAVGLAGLVAVIVVLVVVSNYITLPLKKMNDTAIRIIENFGDDSKIEVEDSTKDGKSELIRTELSDIVDEFQGMVRKFSGGSMARSAKVGNTEVVNEFHLLDEFRELYSSRQNKGFKYNIEQSNPTTKGNDSSECGRKNFGSNIVWISASLSHNSKSHRNPMNRSAFSSPLFMWIVALIVLPLLLSTITISAVVIGSVSQELPDMIHDAENGLVALQVAGLKTFAFLRAGFVSRKSEQYIRDLYVTTRYVSWLLFGGLKADSCQEMVSATEACRGFETEFECPFVQQNNVCDCSWNGAASQCANYSESGVNVRYLQVPYFSASSEDADILTGDRYFTSFPGLAYTPNTTEYWRTQQELPGSPAGSINGTVLLASGGGEDGCMVQGYGTTHSRLQTAAAVPLYVPLFDNNIDVPGVSHAPFIMFEADGSVVSYGGCANLGHAMDSQWQSSIENGAAELRPELCPIGKYGYDPRCRGWYDTGRELYLSEEAPLHVTLPYVYSRDMIVGQSCTAPLFDPETKEHVGQVLVDFFSTEIFETLGETNTPLAKDGFRLLMTPQADVNGADVIFGPGLSFSDIARPLEDVINAHRESCDTPCGFDKIADSLRTGEPGTGKFQIEDADGKLMAYHVAFSPVEVKSLKQVNASNFASGVELVPYHLYSLALAEPEASMLESFQETEVDIAAVIQIGFAILCTVIVVASGLVVWLSNRITISLTKPMYYLLELIRHINRLDVGDHPPEPNWQTRYGSWEVMNVRMTMEKLYKIIQCANAAYFAGETEVAYHVFTEALQLFTRLDNRKAMGVASNNLGNTMLTLYRTLEVTCNETVCGMTRPQIIGKGTAYFHQAIQLGEKAYDEFYETEGWGPNCLHFMQHLSNRYFNRAMFLLTVKDGHEKPKEIEALGMRDLQIARDMDMEIVDEGTQVGWDVRSAEAHLEVLLCRIRGHITLLEMGYTDEWEVDEMLDNAYTILKAELNKDSSDLFKDIGPVGRMQQIEFLLMRHNIVKGDLENSARIGIRMLVEDEFILTEAQKEAIAVMQDYAKFNDVEPDVQQQLKEYQIMLHETMSQKSSKDVLESGRSAFLTISRTFLDSERSNTGSVTSMRLSMRGDIVMEAF